MTCAPKDSASTNDVQRTALALGTCSACASAYVIPSIIHDTSESLRFDLNLCADCWNRLQREYQRDIGSRDSSPNDLDQTRGGQRSV
jgi:hypothetical protein